MPFGRQEPSALIRVTAGMLAWADLVFVMESNYRQRLQERFPEEVQAKEIIVLDIPDDYGYMDEELILMLEATVGAYLDRDIKASAKG